ncbi:hypothetical protein [Streptomyces sp. NPDC003077]|uniref:hypothetical protein n=1 Tax=Streptomyces sp. NPDC003077 TaxID=3154443 RepID=UPI0033A96DBA
MVGAPELRADCIADSAGGLTFDITAPLAAESLWSAALVLRPGGDGTGDAAEEEVRLPLGPDGTGRLRAVLPSTVALAEGHWNAFADFGDGCAPQRLLLGANDLHSLVDRGPLAGIGRLGVRIPYANRHGGLALRSWVRGPHAEAGDLLAEPRGLTVTGRLYGAVLAPGAVAEARAHQEPDGHGAADGRGADGHGAADGRGLPHGALDDLQTPDGTASAPSHGGDSDDSPAGTPGDGRAHVTVPVTGHGPDFTFTLPYGPLVDRWEDGVQRWDLWVRAAADAEPVRLARLLRDVPDRQGAPCPVLPVGSPSGVLRVGPYYTMDNNLGIRVMGTQPH